MAVKVFRNLFVALSKKSATIKALPGHDVIQSRFGELVTLPKTLASFKYLQNIGEWPCISDLSYRFPGLFTPYQAQKKTASFMAARKSLWCLNGMGSGKTAAALWAIDFLSTHDAYERVLILAPLSTIESIWEKELLSIVPNAQYVIAKSTKKKLTLRIAQGNLKYLIANHDKVMHWYDVMKFYKPDLIVLDEASMFRSEDAQRYKALEALIKVHGASLWALTATPCPKEPVDVWPLCRLINPSNISANKYAFRSRVMFKVAPNVWKKSRHAEKVLDQVMQPCIRISREECIGLPDVTYSTRVVAFSPLQKKALDDLTEQAYFAHEGETVEPVNGGVLLSKLLQICSGMVKTDAGNIIDLKPAPRFKELVDLIQTNDGKFLIMSYFRATHDYLQNNLAKKGITTKIIRGGVSGPQRTSILNQFETDPDLHGLILQPRAAGHGLNLTSANMVVWWSALGDAEIYLQANERNRRAGQTSKCTVVHLTSGSIEPGVYLRLKDRVSFQELFIKLKEEFTQG
jgi:SNF2 family DNA or RNA helicase